MKRSALKFLKTALVFTLFVLISSSVRSQYLYFCEDVDDNGDPVTKATTFTISPDGGYLYFYCDVGHNVNCKQIHYSIYSVDYYGSENYVESVYQDVEPTWAMFWKKYTFYHSGDYNVYVYDEYYNLLAKAMITIKM